MMKPASRRFLRGASGGADLFAVLRLAVVLLLIAPLGTETAVGQPAFRDIYQELVEINTTDSSGDTLRAAEAMAARLKAGGFPAADIQVISSGPRKGNLVARLRGTGAR